jgi:dihydroflavonol-4-reductase
MKIAVTGATGHVGLNLVEELVAAGHDVRAFADAGLELLADRPVERIQGDVRDEGALAECFRDVDRVFHLAAVISIDGDRGGLVHDVNVRGAGTAANAALRAGVGRFIHFSSIHAFDIHGSEGVVDESSPRATGTHVAAYDHSKALGEAEVRAVIAQGLDGVILHPTGVIGAVDFAPSRAGRGLLDAARGRMPVIVDGGFDWVDVRDVVSGACAAAERGVRGRSYILAGGRRSMHDMVEQAARHAGAPAPLVTLPRWVLQSFASLPTLIGRLRGREPWFTAESLATLGTTGHFSNQLASDELGYDPRPPEEAIESLVEWFFASGELRSPDDGQGSEAGAAKDSAPTAFERQLGTYPVDDPVVREVLARALVEIAAADDAVDESEQRLLQRFAEPSDAGCPQTGELPSGEWATLPQGTRESILLVATTMACVDEDYSLVERKAVDGLRQRLDVSPQRAAALDGWAREFVIDQRFDDFYADGVLDDAERRRIEQLGASLGVAFALIAKLDARAQKRRGL